MKTLYSILTILILSEKCVKSQFPSAHDELKMLRDKVSRLERTHKIKRDYEPYKQTEVEDDEIYDFIIVGAGSGGSALIRRLSEESHWKILVLEAGGEPDIITDIPNYSMITEITKLNWRYLTEKEENLALGFEDQRMHWARGKGLGGTSLLNGMIHSRGAKADFDKWARLGNPGWSYEEVLPIFEELENCTIKKQDAAYRGHAGPVWVEDPYVSRAEPVFVEAAEKLGYKYVDYNGKKHIGVSKMQGTLKKGLRCSGEKCYIKPVKNRRNLTIRLNSHVTKIIIEQRVAKGVEFVKNGNTYKAYARKEVILCAGVINSPQILLLSGVGPKKQLKKFGIPLIANLPVGQKLYDHPSFYGLGFTLKEPLQLNATKAMEDESFIQLYNEGKGILTSLAGAESVVFLQTHLAKDDVPDIELMLFSNHFIANPNAGQAKMLRLSRSLYDQVYKKYEGQNAITVVVELLHQKSHGRLELQSGDPFEHPKLYSGYFTDTHSEDMKTLIAGIRRAIELMLSPPFKKYGIELMDNPLPNCKFEFGSDEYWECAIRTLGSTTYHQIATCKMGPPNDPEAIVDNRLRVYNIDNLRIADTSIIPITLSGHMNVPAFMIGEKAAKMIKADYL